MGVHKGGTQIKALYKLVSVTKGNVFVIHESWYRGRHMFSSHVYIFFSHSGKKEYLWIVCKKMVKNR